MRRREFITVLVGAAAWPVVAPAQQTAMAVIRYLSGRFHCAPEDEDAADYCGL
jgi:hypothetical protein